jgi:hypothetical protein
VSKLIAPSSDASEGRNGGATADEGAQVSKKVQAKMKLVQRSKPGKKKVVLESEEVSSDDEAAPPHLSVIDCDVSLNSWCGSKLESLSLNLSWRDVNSLWHTWAEIRDPMHHPRWGYKYALSATSKKPFVLGDDEAKWQKITAEIVQNHKDVHAKVKGVKLHLPLIIVDLNKLVSN